MRGVGRAAVRVMAIRMVAVRVVAVRVVRAMGGATDIYFSEISQMRADSDSGSSRRRWDYTYADSVLLETAGSARSSLS